MVSLGRQQSDNRLVAAKRLVSVKKDLPESGFVEERLP
jgi:hypothetical protein